MREVPIRHPDLLGEYRESEFALFGHYTPNLMYEDPITCSVFVGDFLVDNFKREISFYLGHVLHTTISTVRAFALNKSNKGLEEISDILEQEVKILGPFSFNHKKYQDAFSQR
jgi:hypothetical protein